MRRSLHPGALLRTLLCSAAHGSPGWYALGCTRVPLPSAVRRNDCVGDSCCHLRRRVTTCGGQHASFEAAARPRAHGAAQIRWGIFFSLFGLLAGAAVCRKLGPIATWAVLHFVPGLPKDFCIVFSWVAGTLVIELRNALCQPALVDTINKSMPQPYATPLSSVRNGMPATLAHALHRSAFEGMGSSSVADEMWDERTRWLCAEI